MGVGVAIVLRHWTIGKPRLGNSESGPHECPHPTPCQATTSRQQPVQAEQGRHPSRRGGRISCSEEPQESRCVSASPWRALHVQRLHSSLESGCHGLRASQVTEDKHAGKIRCRKCTNLIKTSEHLFMQLS